MVELVSGDRDGDQGRDFQARASRTLCLLGLRESALVLDRYGSAVYEAAYSMMILVYGSMAEFADSAAHTFGVFMRWIWSSKRN